MITVFLFHRVHPDFEPLWSPLSVKRFEEIIKFIKKNYTVINLEDYFLNKENKDTTGKKAMIVFDDGYRDFIEYALPVLKKYNCPSSMYIVTDCIDNQQPPWTYVLDYKFLNTKASNLIFQGLDSEKITLSWKTEEEKISAAKKTKAILKSYPNFKKEAALKEIGDFFTGVEVPKNLMMTWEQINEIKKEGVTIGSHTVSHPLLATIESEAEILIELKKSFEIIKLKTGTAPVTISYPGGSFNEKVKKLSKEAGYELGLAVGQKIIINEYDRFEIPRIDMYEGDHWKVKLFWYTLKSRLFNK